MVVELDKTHDELVAILVDGHQFNIYGKDILKHVKESMAVKMKTNRTIFNCKILL